MEVSKFDKNSIKALKNAYNCYLSGFFLQGERNFSGLKEDDGI
jgi:hypothetical protein